MSIEELINIIEKAFHGVEQPEDITLHVAEAHDSYDYGNDSVHHSKDHKGRWQDVPDSHIEACQCALCYVTAVGMRFYLPAYMCWYLRNFGSESVHTDHALYSLDNHPGDEQLAAYYEERFSLFSKEQMRACALFVKFCADDETDFADSHFAGKKYERHWFQYV